MLLLKAHPNRQAHSNIAESGLNYDILAFASIDKLDTSIGTSLQLIHDPSPSSISLKHRQTGMTLIEIMIALLIGAFLLGGVLQIFISSKQTNSVQEGFSQMQDNGRYALEMLTKDLRLSGFIGCKSINDLAPANSAAAPIILPTPNTIILGYNGSTASPPDATWSPVLPANLTAQAIKRGSDVITILYAESCGGYLTADMASTTADVPIAAANACAVSQGDALLISDCNKADLFRADAGSTSTAIKHSASIPAACATPPCYKAGAEVFAFREYSYFIQPGASGAPSLWRLDNTKATGSLNPAEMIEGIEDMQISYGVDTDPTPDGLANFYNSANNVAVADWPKVVSLRISLLTISIEDNLTAQPVRYTYNDITTLPVDRRIRRVFTTTVALRNRLQ